MKGIEKLNGSIDPILMKNTEIVCVGIGGACQLCESMVRSYLGKLTCIDFDVVDETNIVSQGYFQNEIGVPKVIALGNRLKMINPHINYTGINADLLKMSDDKIVFIFFKLIKAFQ